MKTEKYQNYIFDLYGTLVDIHTNEKKASLWDKFACVLSMMGAVYEPDELKKAYKVYVEEELEDMVPRMRTIFSDERLTGEEVEICLDHVFKRLMEEKGKAVKEETLKQIGVVFRSLSMGYIRLYDGTMELLARLAKAGKKIYLLSNAQRIFTEPEMKMLGIYHMFDGILYSSDAGVKKPSYYFYDTLFQKYGLVKDQCVMIGNDLQADILGAEKYGIESMYLFTRQSGKEPEHLPECCRRLKNLKEVF